MKSFKPNNESRLLCSMTCRVYRKVALQVAAQTEKKKKKDSTEASHVIPHRSTNSAQGCLTSAIGRDQHDMAVSAS
jgi:hypothetical protein